MMSNQKQTTGPRSQRQGVAIILVIAFYAVAITLFGVWIRAALLQQQQARLGHEKMQAIWLADAGIRRAAARLATDADYAGERWQIEAEQLGGNHAAAVEIRIEAIEPPSEPPRVRIVAIAELPAGTSRHVLHTKSTEINLAKPNDSN